MGVGEREWTAQGSVASRTPPRWGLVQLLCGDGGSAWQQRYWVLSRGNLHIRDPVDLHPLKCLVAVRLLSFKRRQARPSHGLKITITVASARSPDRRAQMRLDSDQAAAYWLAALTRRSAQPQRRPEPPTPRRPEPSRRISHDAPTPCRFEPLYTRPDAIPTPRRPIQRLPETTHFRPPWERLHSASSIRTQGTQTDDVGDASLYATASSRSRPSASSGFRRRRLSEGDSESFRSTPFNTPDHTPSHNFLVAPQHQTRNFDRLLTHSPHIVSTHF